LVNAVYNGTLETVDFSVFYELVCKKEAIKRFLSVSLICWTWLEKYSLKETYFLQSKSFYMAKRYSFKLFEIFQMTTV